MPEGVYFIESLEHGPVGNCRVWWGKECKGYTTDLTRAGVYSEDEATEIVQGARGRERAWPVNSVLAAATFHVRAEDSALARATPIVFREADHA